MNFLLLMLYLFYFYIALMTLYLLLFAIAGRYSKQAAKTVKPKTIRKKILVLIPAYKEDTVIVHTAEKALQQSYPAHLFDVVVIADSLQASTLTTLKALPIQVLTVQFKVSSKAGSIKEALRLCTGYQTVVILDADNVMEYHFLEKINAELGKGFVAMQANRTAKNINTIVARLDALSEATSNHTLRKGHRALGLSAALTGSGMAFDFNFYKSKMAPVNGFGEDKELELEILKTGQQIQYLEDAIVYDEKTQSVAAYKNQRTRWIAAQFACLRKYFLPAVRALIRDRNLDFFNKVLQTAFLPRIFFLGMAWAGILISFPLNNGLIFYLSTFSAVCFVATFLLSVPAALLATLSLKDLSRLPVLFTALLGAFYQINEGKKRFLHTPKNIVP